MKKEINNFPQIVVHFIEKLKKKISSIIPTDHMQRVANHESQLRYSRLNNHVQIGWQLKHIV